MIDPEKDSEVVNLPEWEDMNSLKAHLAGDSLMKFLDRLVQYFDGNTTEIYGIV